MELLDSGINIAFLRLLSSKELLYCRLVATIMYTGSLRHRECATRMASAWRCGRSLPCGPSNGVEPGVETFSPSDEGVVEPPPTLPRRRPRDF